MEARVPSMSPAYTTATSTDSFPKRFPRPIPLASPLPKADEQRDGDGRNDEEDKTDGQADFFAESCTARRGGRRRRGVRRVVGTRGRKQGEGWAGEDFGIAAYLVDYEREGEVGGWLAAEPKGAHVEEDGALKVGGVEGREYVCGGWGVEARGVDVVDLDCVVRAVFEDGGVPGHCEVLVFAFEWACELRLYLGTGCWGTLPARRTACKTDWQGMWHLLGPLCMSYGTRSDRSCC